MRRAVPVALGLGSNLGDRLAILRRAAECLAADGIDRAISSSVYETPPWGILDQPDFLNLVLVGETDWEPPAILNYAKSLEIELGREPAPRYGPRRIDIDLIAFGDARWESPGLEVPHPRLAERSFVLWPLREVWPDWIHPISGRRVTELCAELQARGAKIRVFAPPVLADPSVAETPIEL